MITSVSNAKVKEVIKLQKKASSRKAQSLFVVEGLKMFSEAERGRIDSVFVSGEFMKKAENRKRLEGLNYELVNENVMKAISDTVTPQGILCTVKQFEYSIDQILKQERPRLLLLNDLQDPGNAGTILRTAEAAGMDAVILSHGSVDLYNPKTIRSTMGAIYRVPFLYADLFEVITLLKQRRIPVYTTDMKGQSFREAAYGNGFAFIIGNEANGVDQALAACADRTVSIPMCGKTESLNAAVAAALIMYEACYQAVRK